MTSLVGSYLTTMFAGGAILLTIQGLVKQSVEWDYPFLNFLTVWKIYFFYIPISSVPV